MKLILDVGNTKVKTAIYRDGSLVHTDSFKNLSLSQLEQITGQWTPEYTILSAVREVDPGIVTYLKDRYKAIILDHLTPLPITLKYETPETLGKDRIALAVGGYSLFPDRDLLIIDAGTCITYDVVTRDKEYLGGNISLGISMRFKALHTFTDKLPLIKRKEPDALIGNSTQSSILTGVMIAIVAEMEGMIRKYEQEIPGIQVVLSGGDAKFFESQLKNRIFASPNLVIQGLNEILDYNVRL